MIAMITSYTLFDLQVNNTLLSLMKLILMVMFDVTTFVVF